jgi:hypothetical protein
MLVNLIKYYHNSLVHNYNNNSHNTNIITQLVIAIIKCSTRCFQDVLDPYFS